MKDVYEILRQKELEISRLEIEVEALRIVAPLLSENQQEVGHDDQPTATSSTTLSQPTRVPKAVNANPQPEHASVWEEKVKKLALAVPTNCLV